ncbi:polyphosphate kinase 1 [Lactococcus sp.]|uniref:polyphosphate kinase 1 n=1 Tax=Lactococcus sp. TaxID=44273 RepID=UPI0035AFE529
MSDEKINVFTNRELSWLQFNERVLEEAEKEQLPTFERLRFLSIYMNNLDEFYRVRVGRLNDQLILDDGVVDSQTKVEITSLFRTVLRKTKRLIPRFDRAYDEVSKQLKTLGVSQIEEDEKISEKDEAFLRNVFKYKVAPHLTPFIVEKNHPLPFFENERLVLGVTLKTKRGNTRFGFLPIPKDVDKIVRIPSDPRRYMLIEDLIFRYANRIFHKFSVEGKVVFSVVRNADIDESDGLYDYDPDFSETMSKIIEVRNFRAPVMVKYNGSNTPKMLNYLAHNFALRKTQFFEYDSPLEFDHLSEIEEMMSKKMRKKALFTPVKPAKIKRFSDPSLDLIASLLEKDYLSSYPFESMTPMINLLNQAAKDERVTQISMTLYRASRQSKIVSGLIAASKKGKKVTVVIELRARFDEENNIDLSEKLQKAGINVIYGLPGYKVHSKLLLIELSDQRKIALVGTGNFNETTARFYTDLALMTADKVITDDVKNVFDNIAAGSFVQQSQSLLVSPLLMKPKLIEMIDEEIEFAHHGKPARIVMKMNSLTEKPMMNKLIEASQAGVKIDLIIRGICCLIPGIKGQTENIKVRSIVGRYLEHSRIFAFGSADRPVKYYISSADLMTRNLTGRVEAAAPIYDKANQIKIQNILDLCLKDNVNARIQKSNGKYVSVKAGKKEKLIDSQEILSELAQAGQSK